MKINRRSQFPAEVATSSLNDIMFFLLLFFLIISTVANPNVIKVLLPQANAAKALNKIQVNLTVTEDRHYYINKREIPSSKLEAELLRECSGDPDPTVVIRIPHNLLVQDMVDVLQIGARNKIKMVLATRK